MGARTDQARRQVVAARQELLDEAAGLRRSARAAVDLPARARDDPVRVGAIAGGAIFLVLGGPQRLLRRLRRAVLGAPAPRSLLPHEIERAVEGLGRDEEAVKRELEREFARYLEERRQERERSRLSGLLMGATGSLVSALSQRAARRLAEEFLQPRGRAGEAGREAGRKSRD